MSEEQKLKSKLIPIKNAKTITELINAYEMMINSIHNLSSPHIEKVNDFINNFADIVDDDDQFFVGLLKDNLINLYTNRLIRNYASPGFKDE